VQNASHSIRIVVLRVFRSGRHPEVDHETIAALHEDHKAWETLSAEALENFEKRLG
jgi:hypothetical protein